MQCEFPSTEQDFVPAGAKNGPISDKPLPLLLNYIAPP